MAFWLATRRDGQDSDWIQRFDPRFWTVDFPRPMLAALTTPAPDALRIDATFLREGDLAGLIWASDDRLDHPLLAYATDCDYSHTSLAFHWRSSGIIPLDGVNGPTLTIEGEDAAGQARVWYVRLWNYASGTPEDAEVVLPFSQLCGGWTAADDDPVHPARITRMFISLVAPGYLSGSTAPLANPIEGWVELTGIRCSGHRAMLRIGDVIVPPHGLAMATAYDDCCNQTPARLIRNVRQLGYRGSLLHYVGMSHHMRLRASAGAFLAQSAGDPLASPARQWHAQFFAMAQAAGFAPIASLSYELLAQHCPDDWQQRAADGDPARTGWDPPSALLSPGHSGAMAWLQSVGAAFAQLLRDAGAAVRVQIGEPWWWVMPDGRPCFYDAASVAAMGGSPVAVPDLRQPLNSTQQVQLDAAGALLASSTAALRDAVRAAVSPASAEVLLLVFTPTVLDPSMPELHRANLPTGWASPAYDRLQVEDYDWLTAGADARRHAAYALVNARLGYPPAEQDYLGGFVLRPSDTTLWKRIDAGLDQAGQRGAHERFVWALPQVCRDGFVRLPHSSEDDHMLAFDDIAYPLPLGLDTTIMAEFSTSVAVSASGYERRNSLWADARLRFDLGPGIRSEQDLGTLIGFFRARRGAARGFRLRDPSDFSSNGMTGQPGATDQLLGIGDGSQHSFALIKRYGFGEEAQIRRITRPHSQSVMVSLDGVPNNDWQLATNGWIVFASAPPPGAEVRAGFTFDVPVRFAEDRLELAGATFAAGDVPSVLVIEIREGEQ